MVDSFSKWLDQNNNYENLDQQLLDCFCEYMNPRKSFINQVRRTIQDYFRFGREEVQRAIDKDPGTSYSQTATLVLRLADQGILNLD